jgi:hypothetical protein
MCLAIAPIVRNKFPSVLIALGDLSAQPAITKQLSTSVQVNLLFKQALPQK